MDASVPVTAAPAPDRLGPLQEPVPPRRLRCAACGREVDALLRCLLTTGDDVWRCTACYAYACTASAAAPAGG